jgi:hypothetical protein
MTSGPERDAALAAALRANLRRRKAARPPAGPSGPDGDNAREDGAVPPAPDPQPPLGGEGR